MKHFSLKYKLLVLTVVAFFVWALAADMPFTFKAGEVISAEQVNQNFASLNTGKQDRVTGACAEGSAIRLIAADGAVTCETDDVGSGGSGGYTAGNGLKLSGTAFSIDPSKTQARVSATCAAGSAIRTIGEDGKVECEVDDVGNGGGGGTAGVSVLNGMSGEVTLQAGDNIKIDSTQKGQLKISSTGVSSAGISSVKATTGLSGGGTQSEVSLAIAPSYRLPQSCKDGEITKWDGTAWACAKNDSGTAYNADDSSLALSGTTFSIKDNGVSSSKLVDGAVTAKKLSLPLNTNGPYGQVGLSLTNTSTSGAAIALRGQGGTGAGLTITGPVGVLGESAAGLGVVGGSTNDIGVFGKTFASGKSGVRGETSGSAVGYGVSGFSSNGVGVYGESSNNAGVFGKSTNNNAAFFTGGSGGGGSCYYNGGAGWNCTSDKHAKENFTAIDSVGVLEKLIDMPISTWNMKGDANKTPHLGPVAQDFYAAFGLGGSDVTINTADAQGVSLAAIQGLYQLVQTQQTEIETLKTQLESLTQQP